MASFDKYQLVWITSPQGSTAWPSYGVLCLLRLIIYLITPHEGRYIEHPQSNHTLFRGVRVDISATSIHHVLFGSYYVALTLTTEFDYRMRLVWNRCAMRDTDFRW